MDRKEYKSKPQHLVTDARSDEIVRIIHPSNTDIGSSQIPADLKVYGFGFVPDLRSPTTISIFGHRLSLSSSVSLPSADVPSGSILYLTPHTSNCVSLFDTNNSTWQVKQSDSVSLTLSSLATNTNYDAFVFWNSALAALNLELVAWTSNTARTTELASQDGVFVKTGDLTRRYAGTIRTVSTAATADCASRRFVWNHYNKARRFLYVPEYTNQWVYDTAAFRQMNSNIYNALEYVTGQPSAVSADVYGLANLSSATTVTAVAVGVGVDSTTVNSANMFGTNILNTANAWTIGATWKGYTSSGYHKINALERGGSVATTTWYGDANQPGLYLAGINGEIDG